MWVLMAGFVEGIVAELAEEDDGEAMMLFSGRCGVVTCFLRCDGDVDMDMVMMYKLVMYRCACG